MSDCKEKVKQLQDMTKQINALVMDLANEGVSVSFDTVSHQRMQDRYSFQILDVHAVQVLT